MDDARSFGAGPSTASSVVSCDPESAFCLLENQVGLLGEAEGEAEEVRLLDDDLSCLLFGWPSLAQPPPSGTNDEQPPSSGGGEDARDPASTSSESAEAVNSKGKLSPLVRVTRMRSLLETEKAAPMAATPCLTALSAPDSLLNDSDEESKRDDVKV